MRAENTRQPEWGIWIRGGLLLTAALAGGCFDVSDVDGMPGETDAQEVDTDDGASTSGAHTPGSSGSDEDSGDSDGGLDDGTTGGDDGDDSDGSDDETGTTGGEEPDQTPAYDPVLPSGQAVLLMDQVPLRVLEATPATVAQVVGNAQPGDRIELAAGNYGGMVISASGTEQAPIVLAAADPHTAVFQGMVDITGDWLRVDQLEFRGSGRLEARDGASHLRVDRCRFVDNSNVGIRLRAGVRDVRVSRAEAIDGHSWWIYNDVDGPSDHHGPKQVHIDHSYLTGYRDSSTVRLGDTSHNARAFELEAVVEYNLLEDNDGHRELIVHKSSRNWIRWNTITGLNRGDISLRQGSFSEVYGNVMIGAGGITVTATDNLVFNNTIIDGNKGIWLMSGDNTWDMTTEQRPIYDRTERCVVANNTVVATDRTEQGIGVGESFGQEGFPVVDCDVVNNLVVLQSGAPGIELVAQQDNRFTTNWVTAAQGYTADGVTVGEIELEQDGPLVRPVPGSALEGAGTPIDGFGPLSSTVLDDADGELRGETWDIGADQVGGGYPARGLMMREEVGVDALDPYAM